MELGSIDRVREGLALVERGVEVLQRVDLDGLGAEELLVAVREFEVLRRRVDHATDRLTGQLDVSGAYGLDGHRHAKAAVKHLGRLPGAEAHARVRTARVLRRLPAVAAAYEAGTIPTASVRAIVRSASNPRVEPYLEVADPIFAELAAAERDLGRTDVANSDLACGFHNRLKEAGYRPVHAPDGTWILVRPDGTPITAAA